MKQLLLFYESSFECFRGESVEAVLAKEITLKHMAPVIDIEARSNPTHNPEALNP